MILVTGTPKRGHHFFTMWILCERCWGMFSVSKPGTAAVGCGTGVGTGAAIPVQGAVRDKRVSELVKVDLFVMATTFS